MFNQNVIKSNASGFNDSAHELNILSGEVHAYRPVYKLAAGIDLDIVKRGMWLQMNNDGELEAVAGTTGVVGCKLLLQPGTETDIQAFPYDLDGNAQGGVIATMFGSFRAEVGSDGFKEGESYSAGTPLKVVAGKLEPATGSDVVTAYSEGINSRNMLVFHTHGGQ